MYKWIGANKMSVGILGGGLAGLTVAAHVDGQREVLEKDSRGGGHCQTMQEDGFTYDVGGPHIIFSRDRQMVDYMVGLLEGNVEQRRRENKIFYKGRYVKYPFENGLSDLDPQDRYECLHAYLYNDHPAPNNFKEWLYHTFGTGLAEKYLIPYNEKIWNVPAEKLGIEWVEGRVPKPPVEDVIKSAVGVVTEGYTHQLYYQYPRHGGIESIPLAMEKKVPLLTPDFPVERIWKEGSRWCVAGGGGRVKRYDRVVATIPIHELVHMVEGTPEEIRQAVARLRYNSLITVTIGLANDRKLDLTAIYVPDLEVRFHRLSFPKAFSPFNAPDGQSLIQAEITTNEGDGTHELTDGELIKDVVGDLEAMDLLRPSEVCYAKVLRTKYGYVVQESHYKQDLEFAKSYFRSIGIPLCGRVAEFEYINMDVCIGRGQRVAGEIMKPAEAGEPVGVFA
jgi:protoporphyrinogen oxidase